MAIRILQDPWLHKLFFTVFTPIIFQQIFVIEYERYFKEDQAIWDSKYFCRFFGGAFLYSGYV